MLILKDVYLYFLKISTALAQIKLSPCERPFSRWISVSQYWNVTILDFIAAPVKLSPPTNQHSVFLQARCCSCHPTNSVKATKEALTKYTSTIHNIHHYDKAQDRPLFHGVEQMVTKSMTGCSISSTVVLVPRMTVNVGVCPDFSYTIPPLNITYGSLHDTHTHTHTILTAISPSELRFGRYTAKPI